MIPVGRFLVPSTLEKEWKDARAKGVTATMVAKAATASGFKQVVDGFTNPEVITDNDYMKFGRDNEAWIVHELKSLGVLHNDYLIRSEAYEWAMATPDGLSLDHSRIAEVKTTGTDWGSFKKAPIDYRRQVQWQLYVTGAEDCVFAWMLREANKDGKFVPAWFEPKIEIALRDEEMIEELILVAVRLMDEIEKKGK